MRSILFQAFTFLPLVAGAQFTYVSPVPGSTMHNPSTNVILKASENIDPGTVSTKFIKMVGSKSGGMSYAAQLAETDSTTLIIFPGDYYQIGETITVSLYPGIKTASGKPLGRYDLTFTISEQAPVSLSQHVTAHEAKFGTMDRALTNLKPVLDRKPEGFPDLEVRNYQPDKVAKGNVFFYNMSMPTIKNRAFMTVIGNDGNPKFARQDHVKGMDFKMHPNGLSSYYSFEKMNFELLDKRMNLVGFIGCGNGYLADKHECVALDNGNFLLFAYDYQKIDMSKIIEGGQPNSWVTGLVIQEVEPGEGIVVFQWRSWDHFKISDVTHKANVRSTKFNYVHGNAMAMDRDGNILLSSRDMNEVTKISRTTGKILWRWGGKNNQFKFVNDEQGFSAQHCIRVLPNGNYLLFDNGNYHPEKVSSAKEYRLDQATMAAELVWSFKHPDNVFTRAAGSVQRLPNGNTFICWGQTKRPEEPAFTEVTKDGEIVWEVSFNISKNRVYRAHRFEWP